jgi:hypothetical protein
MDNKLYRSLLRGKKSLPQIDHPVKVREKKLHRLTIVKPAPKKEDRDVIEYHSKCPLVNRLKIDITKIKGGS